MNLVQKFLNLFKTNKIEVFGDEYKSALSIFQIALDDLEKNKSKIMVEYDKHSSLIIKLQDELAQFDQMVIEHDNVVSKIKNIIS